MASLDQLTGIVESGGEIMSEVSSGNLMEIIPWSSVGFYGRLLMIFCFCTLGLALFYNYFIKYNKRILVKKIIGDAVIDNYFTSGKVIVDEHGKRKLVLFKPKTSCAVPNYTFTSKLGKKEFYMLYLDENNGLHPIRQDESGLNVEEIKMDSWFLDERKIQEEKMKKKGKFTEQYPLFIVIGCMVLVCGLVYLVLQGVYNEGITMADAIKKLAESIQAMKT